MKKLHPTSKVLQDDFYRLVLESLGDYSVFSMDKKGIITSWNHGAEKVFGYTEKEVLGKDGSLIFTLIDQDDKLPDKEIKSTLKRGKTINELYYIRKDSSLFWASGLMFKLEDAKGKHVGFTKIVRDLTNKKEFENRKDEFISTATHELRNPLTAIQLYGTIVENQARHLGNAPLLASVIELNASIQRMRTLSDYLLDVAKIQDNKLILEKTSFDLNKLVILGIKTIQVSSKNHTFIQKNTLKEKAFADRQRIGQVLTNFLLNAVKYSPRGGKIIITTSKKNNVIECSVQDFGIGITLAQQSKIFTRFFRADITRQHKIEGIGLGLYIAQKIIKGHGGKIWMTSTKGVGSTFSFSLPQKDSKRVSTKVRV